MSSLGLPSLATATGRAAQSGLPAENPDAAVSPDRFAHVGTLSNPEPDAFDWFGDSVAVSGDGTVAVVSARNDDVGERRGVGETYVFERSGNGWRYVATLTNPEPDEGNGLTDSFGFDVAVSGNGSTVVIGAIGDDEHGMDAVGEAYVFGRSGNDWRHVASLSNPEPDPSDEFGNSVSVSGDGTVAVVGARRDKADRAEQEHRSIFGEAYVFECSDGDWQHAAVLENPDPDGTDYFGGAVALSKDGLTAVVGAAYDTTYGFDSIVKHAGQADVFKRTGGDWRHDTTLRNPEPDALDFFGTSVSVSGDGSTAVVGATGEDTEEVASAGEAYVFEWDNGWQHNGILRNPEPGQGDQFGNSVALSEDGSTAVVGAYTNDDDEKDAVGETYVFERSGNDWRHAATLPNPEPDALDLFGVSVDVSGGGTVVVGAGQDDVGGEEGVGEAYVFEEVETR